MDALNYIAEPQRIETDPERSDSISCSRSPVSISSRIG